MKFFLLAAVFVTASTASPATLHGLWDGSVMVSGTRIPFRMEFAGTDQNLQGSFFNGDEKVTSTSGKFENGSVLLRFDDYNTKLIATFKDGALQGTYGRGPTPYAFHAVPHKDEPPPAGRVPSIAGEWEIPTNSPKGEKAWYLIIRQSGAELSAAILRVDGDTGTLTGRWSNGSFTISHFSGARPNLLVVTPKPDGTLDLLQNGKIQLKAVRATEARAKGLPAPDDPMRHTTVKDPNQPLRFSFPDLNGHIVSNSDARFQGKVVIVAIGGSWCPNCHDEAPFLEDLYRKYHSQGLEIVMLAFEEGDQLKNPTRLRAFIKEYGITFPVLLAGDPSELNAKLPQAVNLNAWPTAFFMGRDGRVRAVHTGFAAKASGPLHDQMVVELNGTLARLLGEQVSARRAGTE